MKYVIILGDGMADEPLQQLGGKTPLAYADTPVLDMLSAKSEIGMVHTIPDGMKPGSDTANLSVLGYDPRKYYSGRSPLEALSIGVPMKETDVALRCNIVTISGEPESFEEKTIIDHSSSEISTEDCAVLLRAVADRLQTEEFHFYVGTSYRHCLIWDKGQLSALTPPHDVLGQVIGRYLPENRKLYEMMRKSYDILAEHPVNRKRREQGLNPANCCWFWGAGTRPKLSSFQEKTGKKGIMVSAVDLLKGIAAGTGMDVAQVEGATGGLHTNYEGKARAAVSALTDGGYDFAYIHVEAPDEMGHQGSAERKVQAIEYLDARVIGPVVRGLTKAGEDFRLLVLPDHPTPVRLRTHTADDVPYLLYDSTAPKSCGLLYSEESGRKSGIRVDRGHQLIEHMFEENSSKNL
ncbi:MAG: cofactor-independent phosphoglycerate mutase [Lachnospiraceae bacterium]|nr:cofactor-independent phosphoglycerate mutase [Lachnospiraceae bacterium]